MVKKKFANNFEVPDRQAQLNTYNSRINKSEKRKKRKKRWKQKGKTVTVCTLRRQDKKRDI